MKLTQMQHPDFTLQLHAAAVIVDDEARRIFHETLKAIPVPS
ncbi:MAG TPA: hypothetical protein VK700_01830 [Steroidobacteraceae bacterium]|jgi:hypothetical protein|nr:hypothetical protein [Steroidobacteraceae bacterium]